MALNDRGDWNVFRPHGGALDRVYLRTCTVYRLLKQGRIGKARAIELLTCPARTRTALVELWLNGPLAHLQATS